MKVFHILLFCLLFSIVTLAQNVYEIKFTTGITQYRAALIIWSDGTGKLRVRYFTDGKTRMVEEYMRIENTDKGMRLTGYNPTYPGTNTSYPNYAADNFYISQDENGNLSCINIDDSKQKSACVIRLIDGATAKHIFLKDFNWTINNTARPATDKPNSNFGIYPEGSTRYLVSADVISFTAYQLKIMRNEIFARHGYIFKTKDMQDYFNNQTWYRPMYNDVNNKLTTIEKYNIEFIKKYER